jgi:hypothetical protein
VEIMSAVATVRKAIVPQEETDVEAFVAAVIRCHERIQRNFREMASGRLWPLDSALGTDREIIEGYNARYM